MAELRKEQRVKRHGERKGQRREISAEHRVDDEPTPQQRQIAGERVARRQGRVTLVQPRRGEPGEQRQHAGRCEYQKGGAEPGGGQDEAAKHRAADLAEIGDRVQAPELHAALAR